MLTQIDRHSLVRKYYGCRREILRTYRSLLRFSWKSYSCVLGLKSEGYRSVRYKRIGNEASTDIDIPSTHTDTPITDNDTDIPSTDIETDTPSCWVSV